MDKSLVNINESAKVALNKSKKFLVLTNKLLDTKHTEPRFQFYLPVDTDLTQIQLRAIHSLKPISITAYNTFDKKIALLCFVKRWEILKSIGKKALIIVESELLRFIINEKVHNDCAYNLKKIKNRDNDVIYDEILVYDEYDIKTLFYLKDRSRSLSLINNNEIPHTCLLNNNRFEFDENFSSTYEIYKFAIQFVPYNARANNENLLERLKRKNSGGDKPFVWIENNLNAVFNSIEETINYNPTANIGIILPYGNDKENYNLSVEMYFNTISKKYTCSKYFEDIKLEKIYNIVLTTYNEAKLIDFDILILPQFDKVKKIIDNETIFNAICDTKYQLHIFQTTYYKYDHLVEIIDNRI